jgi:hypothetical protein
MATAVLSFTADTNGGRIRSGRQIEVRGQLVSDNGDYAAGGLAVTASTFGLSRLDGVETHGVVIDGSGATAAEGATWDMATGKISFFEQTGTAAPFVESNNTALSGYTLRVTARGI